jgi:hypothetical protein
MAIAMECFNVIVRKPVITAKYPGGISQCRKDAGPGFLEDEYLIRGGAMSWHDVEMIIRHFEQYGVRYLDDNGKAVDIVVVDMLRGPMAPCDWIEFDSGKEGPRCWLRGTPPGPLSKPDRPSDNMDTMIVWKTINGVLVPVRAEEADEK